jgi:hypothetical protein
MLIVCQRMSSNFFRLGLHFCAIIPFYIRSTKVCRRNGQSSTASQQRYQTIINGSTTPPETYAQQCQNIKITYIERREDYQSALALRCEKKRQQGLRNSRNPSTRPEPSDPSRSRHNPLPKPVSPKTQKTTFPPKQRLCHRPAPSVTPPSLMRRVLVSRTLVGGHWAALG